MEKLYAWASSLTILDFKLRHCKEFQDQFVDEMSDDIMGNEKKERDQALFNELIGVATKIKENFVPLGRPVRTPKLFDFWKDSIDLQTYHIY